MALVHSISTMKLLHKTETVSLNRIRPYYRFTWNRFFFEFLSKDCYIRRLLTVADFGSAKPPSGFWCLVVKAFCMDLVLPADLCNNTRIIRLFYFLTIHRYFNVWYFIIRVWSSTGCECRWPWRYFKLIRLFHIKFLKNGAWYGKSYYGLLIGNHTLAFDWCYFWWLWMIFEGHFTIPSPISRKLYTSIDAEIANKKSNICF